MRKERTKRKWIVWKNDRKRKKLDENEEDKENERKNVRENNNKQMIIIGIGQSEKSCATKKENKKWR